MEAITSCGKSHLLSKDCASHWTSYRISASADFSRRKKKLSRPRKTASSEGFMPEAPVETGFQKREQRNKEEIDSSTTSTSELNEKTPEMGVDADDSEAAEVSQGMRNEGKKKDYIDWKIAESSQANRTVAIVSRNHFSVNGSIIGVDKSRSVEASRQGYLMVEIGILGNNLDIVEVNAVSKRDERIEVDDNITEIVSSGSENLEQRFENIGAVEGNINNSQKTDDGTGLIESGVAGKHCDSAEADAIVESVKSVEAEAIIWEIEARFSGSVEGIDDDGNNSQSLEIHYLDSNDSKEAMESEVSIEADLDVAAEGEDSSQKWKLDVDAQLHKQTLEGLAEDNFSIGNKLFTSPQMVKPGQDIEAFLNRSPSSLKDEPDVMIKGALLKKTARKKAETKARTLEVSAVSKAYCQYRSFGCSSREYCDRILQSCKHSSKGET
ncbi:hypothetical protein Nepgr_021295 [Nepenthes gracilis]|uniref:Uncharacterized protein n=1 Tax=Nepenthes gracilis TaxID=150966 RepID=A0AAD3XWW7_NEPGR|nr:hypothetical protein Nepgr_021295 [Nepenthes gracilis]